MILNKGNNYKKGTKKDKVLYANYVPSRYWRSLNFRFSQLEQIRYDKNTIITTQEQKGFFKLLKTGKISYMVGIGSYPTDDVAKMIAANVTKHFLFDKHLKATWYNVAVREPDYSEPRPDVVILHNINQESPFDRWCRAKDWMMWADDCITLVVMGGIDPIFAMDHKLRTPCDLYFWSKEPLRRLKNV